jgi:hypothetical protein
MNPHHYELPRVPRADIILNQARSYLAVVVPARGVNLVFDPECLAFSKGALTYVGASATLASDSVRQKRGMTSIYVEPTADTLAGIRYVVAQPVTANTAYSFSCDHIGGSGSPFLLVAEDSGTGDIVASTAFIGADFWQRPSLTFSSGIGRPIRLAVYAMSALSGTQPGFWVDGFQIEKSPFPTTFISGNLSGFFRESPNPYGWLGSPHNSASFRLPSTRSGGRLIPLSEMGLDIYQIEGLGMVEPDFQVQRYAQDHGGLIGQTFLPEREFTVTGRVSEAGGIVDLHCVRERIVSSVTPLFGRARQPVRLHYQIWNCDRPASDCGVVDAVYTGGLGMDLTNPYIEDLSVDFVAPDPFIYDCGDAASHLNVPEPEFPEGASGIPARDESGAWRITTPLEGRIVNALQVGPDGYMYTLINQFGTQTLFARWDGFQWNEIDIFPGAAIGLASTPDGGLYIVGSFTYSGPKNILRYDTLTGVYTTVQTTVVTPGSDPGRSPLSAALFHPAGYLIASGHFTNIANTNGSVAAKNIAAYNLATETWEVMGESSTQGLPDTTGSVSALAISPAGWVFAGGDFSASYGGIHNLGRFDFLGNATGWQNVDSPMVENSFTAPYVSALCFGPDGTLWVGGNFNNSVTNNLFRAEADGGFPTGVSYHTNLTNIAYIPDAGGDISEAIFFRLMPVEQGLPSTFRAQSTYVTEIKVDCAGTVHVAGFFGGGLTNQRTSAVAGGEYKLLPSVDYLLTGPDHIWRLPDFILASSVDSTLALWPDYPLGAIAVGTQCFGSGTLFPFGGGGAGSDDVPDDDLGVPSDFAGSIFLGIVLDEDDAPNVIFPRRTVVDTGCSTEVRPVIQIQGPGRLLSIINRTTGSKLEFRDVFLFQDEVLTIDLSDRIPKIYSNVTPNAYNFLTNTHQLSLFYLAKGENAIDVLIDGTQSDGTISADTEAWIRWKPRYESVDALCRNCSR